MYVDQWRLLSLLCSIIVFTVFNSVESPVHSCMISKNKCRVRDFLRNRTYLAVGVAWGAIQVLKGLII